MKADKSINSQSRYFLIFLIFTFGYFIYLVYSNFLFSIIIASLLMIGTLGLFNKINSYTKHKFASSLILTLIVAICFFLPLSYFITSFVSNAISIDIHVLNSIIDGANVLMKDVLEKLNLTNVNIEKYTSFIDLAQIITNILKISQELGKVGVHFVANVAVVLIFYFIMLVYKDNIGFYLKNIIPLKDDEQDEIIRSLSNTMSIVYNSTLITALLEGCLFAIIAVYYGYDGFLFGILYGFASLIPVVGGLLLWVPMSLYEFSIGNTTNAIVIALYSIIVISIITDTFIKPMIISMIKRNIIIDMGSNIHAYIIFFAILAGMTSFGFWGILIGPAVTTIFLTLLYIYNTKYKKE